MDYRIFNGDSSEILKGIPSESAHSLVTDPPAGKGWFLIGALAVAFTRVATHQHYLSDIILGGTIGYLGTLWLHEIKKENINKDAELFLRNLKQPESCKKN